MSYKLYSTENCIIVCCDFSADPFHIFFYEGPSATADLYDDIVLRFAHSNFYGRRVNRETFHVSTNGYSKAHFDTQFEVNTSFPFHAELHINRTRFDYEGEYRILYEYSSLRPNFIISVNSKYMQ